MNEQTIQPKDDRLLTEKEVAERWGVSRDIMRKIRVAGDGPPFMVVGKGARYMLSNLVAFEGGGLISKQQLATRWGVTVRAIELRDKAGDLPAKLMLGRNVRYRLNDIMAIEQAQHRTSGRMEGPRK